ncbi:MAG: helix-turn-helix transcriptional regulator [Prolixibacteraceae bacterium]
MPSYLSFTHSGKIDSYFSLIKIYSELTINDQYTGDTILALLRSMFSKEEKSYPNPLWLKKLHEIIENRWDEFISLEDLALELRVHPVTISKYFRKYSNCTLADYMRKIKIEKALHLILHSKRSITETAFICGFSDHSHMIRLFKFYLGFRPKEISLLQSVC